jgi:hypothetical protein
LQTIAPQGHGVESRRRLGGGLAAERQGVSPTPDRNIMTNIVKKDNDTSVGDIVQEYGLSVLKGAVGAIPFVGTLLNEVAFEARSRLKQRRLEAFFKEIADALAQLSEDKVDRNYLRSEEFSDLFEDVGNRVSQTRDDRKRVYFRNILVKGILGQSVPDLSAMFIALLHEITVEELSVLKGYALGVKWLRDKRNAARREGVKREVALMKPVDWSQSTIAGFPALSYREILQSLIRKGLLFDDSAGRLSTPPYTVIEGTDLGAHFYEWITE